MADDRRGDVFAGRAAARLLPVALMLAAGPVLALPPDAQRPFVAADCAAAQARYAESQVASPLISQAENAEVLAQAEAQVSRLCDGKLPTPFKTKVQNGPDGIPRESTIGKVALCR